MHVGSVCAAPSRLAAVALALVAALWLSLATAALAQPANELDYAAWEQTAGSSSPS